MAFNPKQEYDVVEDLIPIKDFSDFREEYVTRAPYQRKNVWSVKKKQTLLDSLFRRFYIPKIVIREVRLTPDRTVSEIIDGQQRIITVQEFIEDKLKLPKSLADVSAELVGKHFGELSVDLRKFVTRELKYKADRVKNIEDPKNPEHQKIATEIFWRLQQGESLNFMEIAHARLNSLTRNFIVKISDDISFDFENYLPLDHNPHKHPFFKIIDRDNTRMQHLTLMARFILLEQAAGPAELKDAQVVKLIEDHTVKNGVGNDNFENETVARSVLSNLNAMYELFKDDTMLQGGGAIRELKREYIIVSLYLLVRHLRKYYVFETEEKSLVKNFFLEFHERWQNPDDDDRDVLSFSEHRQMDLKNGEARHMIIRQLLFQYAAAKGYQLMQKDIRRAFNEAERISIFRRDKGLCQMCLQEGKDEHEAAVGWPQYEADHILPHAKGGPTNIFNGQVLCGYHNSSKGASMAKT